MLGHPLGKPGFLVFQRTLWRFTVLIQMPQVSGPTQARISWDDIPNAGEEMNGLPSCKHTKSY